MYYILNPHIALRSWWRTPFAYYVKGVRDAQRLTKRISEMMGMSYINAKLIHTKTLSMLRLNMRIAGGE